MDDTTVHPLVQTLQDKINGLSGGPATLASKVDTFAKQANIGSYSWSLGVGEVNKVFMAIGLLMCDNTPAPAAKLPGEWKAPAGESAFYMLTLVPGFDIPVFVAPLDQEDQEGRIGNCLGLHFEQDDSVSNSALGLVLTVGIKANANAPMQPSGCYVVGCRHFVCYAPQKRLQTHPLSAVKVCDNDCASCAVANCPRQLEKSAYKSLTASIFRGNGTNINMLPDWANKCKEPNDIMKPGVDLLWNRNDPEKRSIRPDVLLIPIRDAQEVVPIDLAKAREGWLRLFNYAPGRVSREVKPFFERIDESVDKFGRMIGFNELTTLVQKMPVYVCAKMPYSGYVAGTISTKAMANDYIEITPLELAIPDEAPEDEAHGGQKDTKCMKISRSGDCGTAWFALVPAENSDKVALRLIGHHRGAKRDFPYPALVVPLPAMWNEVCKHLLPHVFPLQAGQSYGYEFGKVFA